MRHAISLEGVSKKYQIFPSRRDRLKKVLSFGGAKVGREFWALKNVNLEVKPGTAVGIMGRNGAGKTTLLQIISGVLQPTSGIAKVNGRLIALFHLGAGFDDEFTGRENVIMNGLILGIERKEMLKRFDEIEAFADVGEFIDQPLKTYSSGMRARLGFAVAVNVKPDILLVDEALSVGDQAFKAKGITKMRELRDSGTTILFVSHSTDQVKNFCTEAILLYNGSVVSQGDTNRVADNYAVLMANIEAQRNALLGLDQPQGYETAQDGEDELRTPDLKEDPVFGNKSRGLRYGTGDAKIQNVKLFDGLGRPVNSVGSESTLTVRVHVQYTKTIDDSVVGIVVRNNAGLDVFLTNTALEKTPLGKRHAGERVTVDFTFPVPLRQGRYSIAAAIVRPRNKDRKQEWLDALSVAEVFEVPRPPGREEGVGGLVYLPTQVKVFEPDIAREHKPPT